ncbi:MAG: GIY-YIG nuclease family protein [Patescibacteria group bacterium]
MYYVYLLYSLKDKKFYIGFTSNLKDRVKTHNAGGAPATKNRRPCKLIFYEGFLAKGDALRREKYFKTNPGKKSLHLILRETLSLI